MCVQSRPGGCDNRPASAKYSLVLRPCTFSTPVYIYKLGPVLKASEPSSFRIKCREASFSWPFSGSQISEAKVANPNDVIRSQILQYFYDRNVAATSRRGKTGSGAKISDVKRDLKSMYGLSQQQVVSNLNYLLDRGWVKAEEVEKTVRVRGGTIPSTVTWYEIAAPGIEKVEGESEFTRDERFAGINISATGSNIITLGSGNVVNATFRDLHGELTELESAVKSSDKFAESEKLDIAADIESIKDQLAKREPNSSVVRVLWEGISNAVTAAGLAEYAVRIAPLIAGIGT
jgi:hypothetical protein